MQERFKHTCGAEYKEISTKEHDRLTEIERAKEFGNGDPRGQQVLRERENITSNQEISKYKYQECQQ